MIYRCLLRSRRINYTRETYGKNEIVRTTHNKETTEQEF